MGYISRVALEWPSCPRYLNYAPPRIGPHAGFDRQPSTAHDERAHPQWPRGRRRSFTDGFPRLRKGCHLRIMARRSHGVLLTPPPPLASQFSLAVFAVAPATPIGIRTRWRALPLDVVFHWFETTHRFGFGTPRAAGLWWATDVHRLPIDCRSFQTGWPTTSAIAPGGIRTHLRRRTSCFQLTQGAATCPSRDSGRAAAYPTVPEHILHHTGKNHKFCPARCSILSATRGAELRPLPHMVHIEVWRNRTQIPCRGLRKSRRQSKFWRK